MSDNSDDPLKISGKTVSIAAHAPSMAQRTDMYQVFKLGEDMLAGLEKVSLYFFNIQVVNDKRET